MRLPVQNNLTLFSDWYVWSLVYKDCDPSIWMMNYLFKRFEFNSEQKYWLCWLYGNTYNLPAAWLIWNEFPDYELVTDTRLEKWNNENYKRLRYQTDTKYNKGHLPDMFRSYKKMIGDGFQEEFYAGKGFDEAWKEVNQKQYKFGRYTTWYYFQSLYECAGAKNLYPTSMFFSDYSGSRSHRNGWLLALDYTELVDKKLSKEQYMMLENKASDYRAQLVYLTDRSDINPYTFETCLCSFKKIFREREGRYLGYYLDRQAEEIIQLEKDNWPGVDWNVLWQARSEVLDPRLVRKTGIQKELFGEYLKYNRITNLEWLENREEKKGLEKYF